MSLSKHHNRWQDGTIFGVSFKYSISTQEYILPNGKRFDESDYDEMYDYVMQNASHLRELESSNPNSLSASVYTAMTPAEILQAMQEARRIIDATPPPIKIQRSELELRNRKVQLKWDAEFNRKVLHVVRECIEKGSVHIAKMQSVRPSAYEGVTSKYDKTTIEEHLIVYPSHRESVPAYMYVREQAEKIVKTLMPPPEFVYLP